MSTREPEASGSTNEGDVATPSAADAALGTRLRSIRRQKDWSLNDVQAHTHGEFRASVLGAYERGERSISVPRLLRLAEVYAVPVEELLEGSGRRPPAPGTRSGFRVDLAALAETEGAEAQLLRRMVRRLQVQRQDFGGSVLTVRGEDIRVLAAALGMDREELERFYEAQGLGTPS